MINYTAATQAGVDSSQYEMYRTVRPKPDGSGDRVDWYYRDPEFPSVGFRSAKCARKHQ